MPVDELIREMREDTGAPVYVPELALAEARWVLEGEKDALKRLDSFAASHGVRPADDPGVQETLRMMVAMYGISSGMAHAMLVAVATKSELATYAVSTVRAAGFEMRQVLDLGEMFRE